MRYNCIVYLTRAIEGLRELSRKSGQSVELADKMPMLTFYVRSPLDVDKRVEEAVSKGQFIVHLYDVDDMPHIINLNHISSITVMEES